MVLTCQHHDGEEVVNDAKLLRLCGIDTRGLSAAEIAKGAKLAARVTREDCGLRGCVRVDSKAVAEWQAFRARINTRKPSSDRNRDRHSPGYMRDYMRRRRAAQKQTDEA
jgi:hypothetical protein